MSICTDVGSFIESKTTVVQASNVGFTSEVSDYLVVRTGPGWVPSINAFHCRLSNFLLFQVVFSFVKLYCHRLLGRPLVSPLLHSLHWLPISDRIDYKIFSLTHSAICGTGPEYLSELVQTYTPSRPLRSSSDTRLLCIPPVRTKNLRTTILLLPGPYNMK